MRRFASNSSHINAAMIFGAGSRTSAAALSSQSLRTTSAPLFSRSASLAVPATARLFARTSATPFNLAGKPIQHRFASTATEGAAAGRTRSRLAVVGVIVAAVGGVTGVVFAAEGGNAGEQGGFFADLKAKLSASKDKLLNIDTNKKALPDAHPPPYGKPITVIVADEVLCVQEYQPLSGGMLTKKRPGVEFFLAQLGQDYEVVIWSGQPITSFGPVIEKLDPNHHALHRLYVDATVLNEDGLNVKDLKLINRPMDKTIVLDVKSENVVQKENLVLAPKYDGRLEDVYLLELLNFFRLLAASSKSQSGVPDVRNWVAAVNKNGPAYFKQLYAEAVRKAKERAAQEMQQRQATQATRERW